MKVRRCVRRTRLLEQWQKMIDSKFHQGIGLVAVQPLPEDRPLGGKGDHDLVRN